MDEKNAKITKWSNAYKSYASSYNVNLLNSFNPELQFKDNESAIRNKLIDLLSQFRGFNFWRREREDATKYTTFYSNSKTETIINECDTDESMLRLYQTYKKVRKRFRLDYWFSCHTTQKMEKFLMENFIFCALSVTLSICQRTTP